MSECERAEAVRDYAFDELPAGERAGMEQHMAGCGECAAELERLRFTTAALRMLPDREMPQRIAFVSDKVFAPSRLQRLLGGFWNSAARLGFASACILGGALIFSAWHRPVSGPVEARTVAQTAGISKDAVEKQVNDAVAKAVTRIHEDDMRVTKAAVSASGERFERENRALMEAITVLQAHRNLDTLASAEVAGQ